MHTHAHTHNAQSWLFLQRWEISQGENKEIWKSIHQLLILLINFRIWSLSVTLPCHRNRAKKKKICKNAFWRDESFNYSQFLSDVHGHWASFVIYMIDEASWKSENKESVAYFAQTSAQTICDLTLPLGVQQTKTINSNQFTFPCTWSLFTFWETTVTALTASHCLS